MPVVSAAALKGDHLDALSRQEGRRQTVGIYRLLFEIGRQTQQGLFTLREPISR